MKHLLRSISVVFILVVLLGATGMHASAAVAASDCECVGFVKHYFGIPVAVGNAKNMGTWLLSHGFRVSATPVVGSVAVMQPAFLNQPSTSPGHVGIVTNWTFNSTTNKYRITLMQAQTSSSTTGTDLGTLYGCSHVASMPFVAYNRAVTTIAYYVPNWTFYWKTQVTATGQPSTYWFIPNDSTVEGTALLANIHAGSRSERFNLIHYPEIGIGNYRLISRLNGFCLVPNGTGQGVNIVQKSCRAHANEVWTLYYPSGQGPVSKWQNRATGYAIALSGGSLEPQTHIIQSAWQSSRNQLWRYYWAPPTAQSAGSSTDVQPELPPAAANP